jgi:hypothetical protein
MQFVTIIGIAEPELFKSFEFVSVVSCRYFASVDFEFLDTRHYLSKLPAVGCHPASWRHELHRSYARTVPRPQKQLETEVADDLLSLRTAESRPQSLLRGLVPPLELLLSYSLDEQVFLLPVPMATGSPWTTPP